MEGGCLTGQAENPGVSPITVGLGVGDDVTPPHHLVPGHGVSRTENKILWRKDLYPLWIPINVSNCFGNLEQWYLPPLPTEAPERRFLRRYDVSYQKQMKDRCGFFCLINRTRSQGLLGEGWG